MASFNKFIFIIAGIVAVMATLIILPGVNSQNSGQQTSSGVQNGSQDTGTIQLLSIDYSKQNFTSASGNATTPTESIQLSISSDGSAKYSLSGTTRNSITKDFSLSSDEFSRLKALLLETGFMQIPGADYPRSDNSLDYTKYSLIIHYSSGNIGTDNSLSGTALPSAKTLSWVNLDASQTSVPPIIRNIGAQLDEIISSHQ